MLLTYAIVAFSPSCLVTKWSFDLVLLQNLSWPKDLCLRGVMEDSSQMVLKVRLLVLSKHRVATL